MGEYSLKGFSEGLEQKSSCEVPVLAGCDWPRPWGQSGPLPDVHCYKDWHEAEEQVKVTGPLEWGRPRDLGTTRKESETLPCPSAAAEPRSLSSPGQEAVLSRWGAPSREPPPDSAAIIIPVPSNPWPRSKRALNSATRTLGCSERMVLDAECAVCQRLNMPNI